MNKRINHKINNKINNLIKLPEIKEEDNVDKEVKISMLIMKINNNLALKYK
jgi:hypothetical protein